MKYHTMNYNATPGGKDEPAPFQDNKENLFATD